MALSGYAQDNEDAVAPSKLFVTSTSFDPVLYADGVHWHDLIQPYVDRSVSSPSTNKQSGVVWGCPRWQGRDDGSGTINRGWTGYGKNYVLRAPQDMHLDSQPTAIQEWNWPAGFTIFRFGLIKGVSSRILIGDSIDWHIFPDKDNAGTFFSWSGDPKRHRGKANYVFCDLHVSSLPQSDAWNGFYRAQ
jgi:prepilin-type processing-associated H-X9-DG protein